MADTVPMPSSTIELRLQFETLLVDVSARLVKARPTEIDAEITTALQSVLEFFEADRCGLVAVDADTEQAHVTHGAHAPGVDVVPAELNLVPLFPWVYRRYSDPTTRLGPTSVIRLSDVPPEGSADVAAWAAMGVKSNLAVPVSIDDRPRYLIALHWMREERVGAEQLVPRLRLLGEILVTALERNRATMRLSESESRLSLAAASAGAGLWGLDIATGRIWATPEAKMLYGFLPDEEVRLADVLERVHPEDREGVRTRLQQTLSQRASYSADYRLVLPDGSIRWINACGRPHAMDPGDQPDRLLGVSADVTDRKRADLQLKEQEARLAAAMDAVALGFYETQEGNRIVLLDDRVRELLGIPPEEEGRTREFWAEHIHPDDRAAVLELSRRIIEGELDRGSTEYRYLHPRQSPLWLGHVSHVLERDAAGRAVRIAGVFQDITERKLAESALRDRTERLSMALASARMGAWDVKLPELTMIWAESSEDLFGLGPGRFPGHVSELASFRHPDHREALEAAFTRLRTQVGQDTIEARLEWPDGSEHWHQIFVRSIAGPAGSPARLAGLTLDITDRRRREAELRQALDEVARLRDQLSEENLYLRQEMKGLQSSKRVIGQSTAIRLALAQAERVAATTSTVLLIGETGTGKERFASLIHDLSPRRERPMVRVNCAAIPTTLIESELFGREKGAYTGALSRQAGRFELAQSSTLFLDEIGDLPTDVQVKLLRVLQEKQIERLGSPRPIPVDVRIIAATNQDLAQAVRESRFREDLYYRLNVFPIVIPPLRERREDIPSLVAAILDELGTAMNKRVDSIAKASMDALMTYAWPGNIRELRNILERAMILATGPVLHVEIAAAAGPAASRPGRNMQDVEREHILDVLRQTGWRIRGARGAASVLGLKPTTLEGRMARLGIARPGRR